MGSVIEPDTWVRQVCGLSEAELLFKMREMHAEKRSNMSDVLRQFLGEKEYRNAGNFSEVCLKDLRPQTNHGVDHNEDNNSNNGIAKSWPDFVIRVRKPRGSDLSLFDTSALQVSMVSANSRPVMFQVASNFNCHENGSAFTDVFGGTYLTNMMCDATQGPSAAAGAGIGAIKRWLRHFEQPIELLGDLKQFGVQNGKLHTIDPSVAHKDSQIDFDLIKIGVHTDVGANFDRSMRNTCVYYPKSSRTIDQVFVSTVSMRLFRNSKKGGVVATVAMRELLKAAYDGTYLAACARNTSVLVLTLVGGGVFENPLCEIATALANAHVRYGAGNDNLKTVFLPLFDSSTDYKSIVRCLIAAGCPESSIKIEFG